MQDDLKVSSTCPLCGEKFESSTTRIVGEDAEAHLLHVTCSKCHNSILTLVHVSQTGISSIGLITDLTFEDVMHFKTRRAMNTNDVIELHELLMTGEWLTKLDS